MKKKISVMDALLFISCYSFVFIFSCALIISDRLHVVINGNGKWLVFSKDESEVYKELLERLIKICNDHNFFISIINAKNALAWGSSLWLVFVFSLWVVVGICIFIRKKFKLHKRLKEG